MFVGVDIVLARHLDLSEERASDRKPLRPQGDEKPDRLEPAWPREHLDYVALARDSFNRSLVEPERYRHQAAK